MITLNRKVRFSHPDITYSVTNYTEYLFGSIGLKCKADIRVDIAWSTLAVNMTFDGTADTILRLDGGLSSWIADGFVLGDTITITGTASNNVTTTVIGITDNLLSVTAGALTNETVVANVYGETPITSMDFYPNRIENNAGFNLFDLTDRETAPRYFADTITTDAANPTPMTVGSNSKGWITPHDSATVYRLSFTNHIQTFVITHAFDITPVYIAGQLEQLQHHLAPASGAYQDRFALKYVFTIDGKFSAYDPNINHTTDGNVDFAKGQTGWFNEFINGRPSTWTKNSISYTDNATSAALTSIDYCKTVDIEAKINAQTSGEASFKVQVMYLPTNEDRYVNTLTDWKTNFVYERAVVYSGGATIQGENTGDYHFLKNVYATALAGNVYKVNFQVDFSQIVIDLFDTLPSDNLNYLIFITAQHTTASLTILSIDQVAVIMDVNVYQCDKDDATLFQIIDEVQFFEYPECNGTGYSDFSLLPMDTVVAKAQFHVKQGTELSPIHINNLTASIIAVRQNDLEEFPLESFTINTGGFLPNCDNIQEIEFLQERDFILPDGDCRNDIRLFRMPTLDISGYSAYELIYPFKVRWEQWRQLQGANRCFPTPTQSWMIYANLTGWSIKFSVKAEVERITDTTGGGHTTRFEHITWGRIKDPCDIPYSVEINSFDPTGINSYEEVVAKDTDTYILATINGDFNGISQSELYGILTLDAWGVGGIAYAQEIGTEINVNDDFVWYGAGSTLVATLTKVNNNTLTLSAYLNYLNLPKDTNQFIVSARVGKKMPNISSSGHICFNETILDIFTCGELQILKVIDGNTIVVSGQVDTQQAHSVFINNFVLTFITATTWTITGGTINGNTVITGSAGGKIIKAPVHPYTNAIVGDTIKGHVRGFVYSGDISCPEEVDDDIIHYI